MEQLDPTRVDLVLALTKYALAGFAVLATGLTVVAVVIFRKSTFSGDALGTLVQRTELAKLATIVLIILSVTLMGVLGVVRSEAVVAVLSGIAGYVLGDQRPPRASRANETQPGEK